MRRKVIEKIKLLKSKIEGYIPAIDSYTINDLKTRDEFKLSGTDVEGLECLKYVKDDAVISFSYLRKDNDFKLLQICKFLKKYNKHCQLEILFSNDSKYDIKNLIFSEEFDYDNVILNDLLKSMALTLKQYIEYETILDEMVKSAQNLSVFERFIYAYNVTKMFKDYKENENCRSDSRDIYRLLNNEYIVCAGFANLFIRLLKSLNIESDHLKVDVAGRRYKIDNGELVVKEDKADCHARVFVNLKDEKYDIDGYYISDVTLDNDLFEDYYSYLLVTLDEDKSCRYDFISYDLNILDIKCREDLYEKMKKYSLSNSTILRIIEHIDKEFIEFLNVKYKKEYDSLVNSKEVNSMTIDIADHILSKNNNKVSGKVILKGVREIYKLFYGYDESTVDEAVRKTQEVNKATYLYDYPRVLKDGKYVVNEDNKFDFTYELKKVSKNHK